MLIYQEAATKRIYSDLASALNTDRLMVTTLYNIRGFGRLALKEVWIRICNYLEDRIW